MCIHTDAWHCVHPLGRLGKARTAWCGKGRGGVTPWPSRFNAYRTPLISCAGLHTGWRHVQSQRGAHTHERGRARGVEEHRHTVLHRVVFTGLVAVGNGTHTPFLLPGDPFHVRACAERGGDGCLPSGSLSYEPATTLQHRSLHRCGQAVRGCVAQAQAHMHIAHIHTKVFMSSFPARQSAPFVDPCVSSARHDVHVVYPFPPPSACVAGLCRPAVKSTLPPFVASTFNLHRYRSLPPPSEGNRGSYCSSSSSSCCSRYIADM